jgi:hypothetical protein
MALGHSRRAACWTHRRRHQRQGLGGVDYSAPTGELRKAFLNQQIDCPRPAPFSPDKVSMSVDVSPLGLLSGESGGQRRNIGRPVQVFGWLRAFSHWARKSAAFFLCDIIHLVDSFLFGLQLDAPQPPAECSAISIFQVFSFKEKEMSIWLIPPRGGRHQEFKFVYLWP